MPPRTRRGAPRGGAAAPRAPKQEEAPASASAEQTSHTLAQTPTVISSSENTPAPPSLPPSAASSTPIPSTARSFVFKPKVVRRTDDERKALAEQEEKKFNDRAAEEARLKRAASRGRGRGRGGRGRGRGDFGGGRDGLNRRTVEADGPFSQVPGAAPGGSRGGRPGFSANGGGFSAGGGGGISSGGGGGGGGGGSSTFSAVAADHEYDPRLNTETFMGRAQGDYSDAKDEQGDARSASGSSVSMSTAGRSGKSANANLLPMGIRREEHREPEVIVTTTAELEAADAAAAAAAAADLEDDDEDDDLEDDEDDELFYDNTGVRGNNAADAMDVDDNNNNNDDDDDNEVWSRAITTDGSVTIIDANGNEIVVTDIDTLAEKQAEIAAARAERAAAAAVVKEEADDLSVSLDSLPPKTAKKEKKARAKKAKKALLPKDAEDIALEQGLQAMLHDLAMDQPPKERLVAAEAVLGEAVLGGEGATPAAEEGDAEEAREQPPRREGRLFLFQFPPVLPSLKPAGSGSGSGSDSDLPPTPGLVKREPGDGDVVMDGVAPIDLTESSSTESASASASTKTKERVNLADIGQGGFLGTLSIRQSGRAELSWGGMTYEMMPGTDVNFLTTAVLLEESDEKRKGEASAAAATMVGNAFGMGPVGGKYNLVPVFSDEADWVVDPSELVVDDEEEE